MPTFFKAKKLTTTKAIIDAALEAFEYEAHWWFYDGDKIIRSEKRKRLEDATKEEKISNKNLAILKARMAYEFRDELRKLRNENLNQEAVNERINKLVGDYHKKSANLRTYKKPGKNVKGSHRDSNFEKYLDKVSDVVKASKLDIKHEKEIVLPKIMNHARGYMEKQDYGHAVECYRKALKLSTLYGLETADDCIEMIKNIIDDKNKVHSLSKDQLYNVIILLPPYEQTPLLTQCLDRNSELGQIFWKKRGIRECSLESGTLHKVCKQLHKVAGGLGDAIVEDAMNKENPKYNKSQVDRTRYQNVYGRK